MAFFQGAQNVDARGGTFNQIQGDQINHYGPNPSNTSAGFSRRPAGPVGGSSRPGTRPRFADPPSWASRSADPPSWSSRNQEPPSWAAQRKSGAVDSFASQSPQDRNPKSGPNSTQSQTRSSGSLSGLSAPVHSRNPVAGPQWITPDTSTVPDFSHLPSSSSSESELSSSVGGHQPSLALIHREKLENVNKSMDDALCSRSSDLSPLKDPVGWLKAEGEYLTQVLHDIGYIAEDDAIIDIMRDPAKIAFPRLMVYTLAHLLFCADDQWAMKELKKYISEWHEMGEISRLENHLIIKDWLFDLFGRILHKDKDLHPDHMIRTIAAMDVIGLSAHLAVAVTDEQLYKQFYARRYQSAQRLLDLLQARLDLYIDPAFKQRHVKALVKLSESSGLYPACLVLNDVTLEPEPVAAGGFGEVYKGTLRGHQIAVKMLRVYQSSVIESILKEFAREAVTWRQLSHPNVLPFYGVYHLPRSLRVCLVCPWMDKGNAVEYLAATENNSETVDCVTLALDVAKGLEYLHNANVIHADLKGLNILITPSNRACLADFGLAATRDSSKAYTQSAISSTGHATGTLRWQAPELFPSFESTGSTISHLHNTKATDMYAYAMTVYELFSGLYPFSERLVGDYQVIRAVGQGLRPPRPTDSRAIARGLTDAVWTIIQECWAQEPESRPTTEQVVARLEGLDGLPEDKRPKDDFDLGLLTKVLQAKTEHPFATLITHDSVAEGG